MLPYPCSSDRELALYFHVLQWRQRDTIWSCIKVFLSCRVSSTQDLVEKVVVLRRAVEQTQRSSSTTVCVLLAEKMSQYANLLASQGSLSTAITYLPDNTNQVGSTAVIKNLFSSYITVLYINDLVALIHMNKGAIVTENKRRLNTGSGDDLKCQNNSFNATFDSYKKETNALLHFHFHFTPHLLLLLLLFQVAVEQLRDRLSRALGQQGTAPAVPVQTQRTQSRQRQTQQGSSLPQHPFTPVQPPMVPPSAPAPAQMHFYQPVCSLNYRACVI